MSYQQSLSLFAFTTLVVTGCAMDGPGATEVAAPHCVQQLPSGPTSCFGSFTEALAVATGGQITDAPADAKAALADPGLRARINGLAAAAPPGGAGVIRPLTTVVVGVEYRDDNFQGPTLMYTAATGCDGDLTTNDFLVAAIPDPWNDQISSFQAFSNCQEQLYEAANFGGAQTPLAASLSSVGPAMNDRASSIKWF